MGSIKVQVALGGLLAKISLSRPEKMNAFTTLMRDELIAVFDETDRDDLVRVVIITGAGKAFCAGQDISELVGDNKIEIGQILSEHYNPIVKRIRNMPKPVVAAVNGVAAGADQHQHHHQHREQRRVHRRDRYGQSHVTANC